MGRMIHRLVLLVPCLVIGAWAQDVTLTLENAGPGNVMGGVYTSPYGISVNGTTVPLICDDFTTDISFGESWSAIPTTFAAIEAGTNPANTPKFTPTDIQNYATVAVLAAELEALPDNSSNSEQLGEISYALWNVFDPSLLSSTSNPYGSITGTELSFAKGYWQAAVNAVNAAGGSSLTSLGQINTSGTLLNGAPIEGMTIYTPDPKSSAQEFVTVTTPEASLPATLGVELSSLVGVIFLMRRRLVRAGTPR